MHAPDTWFGIEGEQNGQPYIVRGREDVAVFQESGLYDTRIEIVWTYTADNPAGMPNEALLKEMETAEHLLVEALEPDDTAILAFVFTGNNHRVWYWYTHNRATMTKRINEALSAIPEKLPLQLFAANDPHWDAYHQLLD